MRTGSAQTDPAVENACTIVPATGNAGNAGNAGIIEPSIGTSAEPGPTHAAPLQLTEEQQQHARKAVESTTIISCELPPNGLVEGLPTKWHNDSASCTNMEGEPKLCSTHRADIFGWLAQVQQLNKQLAINRSYSDSLDDVANQFFIVPTESNIDVRIHAAVSGTEISGTWYLLKGQLPSTASWIGLFPHRSIKEYVNFVYANGTAGEFNFKGLTPGKYQARLFGDKFTSSLIAETAAVNVGPEVASFTARVKGSLVRLHYLFEQSFAPSHRDWIGIYETTQQGNKHYLRFVHGNSQGRVEVNLPHSGGKYEARLFAAGADFNELATVIFTT